MNEKNKPSLLLTLGAAGLLIGGGVTAYWLLVQRNELSVDMPMGANIIPQDALLTVSVSTEPRQWQQLRQFGTKQMQAQLNQNLAEIGDRFLTAQGYNYQQDIQPWVGKEVTIAFLPQKTNTSTNNSTPQPPATGSNRLESTVMVLPIKNPLAASQLLEKPKPLKQGKWIERRYKDVQIRETQGTLAQNYSAALLDRDFLVVTDNPKATERAIDTYKGGTSITQTPGYAESLGKISAQQRFAQFYVNIPAAARAAAGNPTRGVSPQGLAQLQNTQGLATTMTLESEGISFKAISWLKPNTQQVHLVENKAGKMQHRLPPDTLMMLSGGNLQQLWQDYVRGVKSNSLTPIQPKNLRAGVKSLTGLDLDRDLLSWMNGEFAISVIPAAPKAGASQDFALSLVFMIQTSARTRAEQTFEQLEQVISRQYQFKVKEAKLKGQTLANWIAPYGTLIATRGWLDDNVAFLTLGAPVADSIVPKPSTTLASTEQFQKTLTSQLRPNNGSFFLNVNPTVKALPLPQFFPGQRMFLEGMRSIGITTAVSDQRSVRYDVFVGLEKQGVGSRE